MEENKNYTYGVAYKLYTITDGEKTMVEEAPAGQPFRFISGLSMTLPRFEENITCLEVGDSFDFVLEKDEAYGEHYQERIVELDKNIFCIDGKLDTEHIYIDAIVPLQNADGNRFMGRVLAISEKKVRIDLNHPLAGKTLNFTGSVVEKRETTNAEIQAMVSHMSGGCSGGCGNCGGECGNCGGECDGGCQGDCQNGCQEDKCE